MKVVFTIAFNDLRILLRDRAGSFFTLVFPIVFALFFGTIFSQAGSGGGDNRIKVLVVDEDRTEGSAKFIKQLGDGGEMAIGRAETVAEAEKAVLGAKAAAYIRLPAGFGEGIERMFWGGGAKIEVGVDPSRRAESGMLQGLLQRSAFQGVSEAFGDPAKMRERVAIEQRRLDDAADLTPELRGVLGSFYGSLDRFMTELPRATGEAEGGGDGATGGGGFQPVTVEMRDVTPPKRPKVNSYAISFPQGMVWAILGASLTFGVSLIVERKQGTLARLRAAPIGRGTIIAGKATACFVAAFSVMVVMLAIAALPPFRVRPPVGDLPLVLLVFACVCLGFVGVMMLVASLGKTEAAASGIGWGVMLLMAMLGGGMVPLMFMPTWMQDLASISPIKWTVLALEGVLWRGFTPVELLLPCGIMVAVGLTGIAVGTKLFSWQE